MARSRINSTCIETGVDAQAKEFDLDFSGQADQVQVPNIDFGNLNLVHGVWMSCSDLHTCHEINRFP